MPINKTRLDQALDTLQHYPDYNPEVTSHLREFVLTAKDDELRRINAHALAAAWQFDVHDILEALLYASRLGVFDMHWESHCPHCAHIGSIHARLGALEQELYCAICDYDFDTHLDENIEVTFNINSGIRSTEPSMQAYLPHGVTLIGEYETAEPLRLALLKEGKYFILDGVSRRVIFEFDVKEGYPSMDSYTFEFDAQRSKLAWEEICPGNLCFTVKQIERIAVSYWDTSVDLDGMPPVRGIDIITLPAFQSLFSVDMLTQRESLTVRNLTILFTDITGSTVLYEKMGDARAYNLVRDHFEVVFTAIESHQGVVVKTIGDAVMAAFAKPDKALEAALDAQQAIQAFNKDRSADAGHIFIKVGMHMGGAIAVNLNDHLDYFGNMVNLAARIQGQSRSGEILLSETVYQDAEVQCVLQQHNSFSVSEYMLELRGIQATQRLFSVRQG